MISIEQAKRIILKYARLLPKESIDITASLNRVLAENIFSKDDIPCFDRSAMDGFAIRSKDTILASKANPIRLRIISDIPAGRMPKSNLKDKTAIRIMTGAVMPKGADSVVMQEDVEVEGNFVKVFEPVKREENVGRRGEDVKKGELILRRGISLRPQDVAMLATLGYKRVSVTKRPSVSILSTGDEVVDITEPLKAGFVRDGNSYGLYCQTLACGGDAVRIGIARDNKTHLNRLFKKAIGSNIIILSGGVSVGDYDYVKDILLESGIKMKFWKVRIKPGKPTFFGVKGKTLVFGLPGYPVSSMLTFELFVKPAIYAMLGRNETERFSINAILDETVRQKKGRRNFIRAITYVKNNAYHVKPTGIQKSGVLKSLVLANSLLVIPEDTEELKKGTVVEIIPFM